MEKENTRRPRASFQRAVKRWLPAYTKALAGKLTSPSNPGLDPREDGWLFDIVSL
jgi:hypothetical protein